MDALAQSTQPSEGQKGNVLSFFVRNNFLKAAHPVEPKIALTLKELVAGVGKERQISGYPMVLIGTTTDADKVPKSIRACFNREVECTVSVPNPNHFLRLELRLNINQVPAETQRLKTLQALLHEDVLGSDVSLKDVAMQTAALLAGDLRDLTNRARLSAIERAT